MHPKTKGIIAGVFANAIFGINVVWLRQALDSFSPYSASVFRIGLAVILLFIYAKLTHRLEPIKKKDVWLFVLGGVFMPYLFFIFGFEAVAILNALLVGIINTTLPLFSPIAGHIFFREKFHKLFFVGLVVSFVGVIIAITDHGLHINASTLGIILAFVAIFCYIGFTVVIHKLSFNYNETTNIFYTNLFGLILLIPTFFIVDWQNFLHVKLTFTAVSSLLKMAIFSSFIGFLLYGYSIKQIGTGKSLILFNLVPIFTTAGSVIILGQTLTIHRLTGLIIVLLGLAITMIQPHKHIHNVKHAHHNKHILKTKHINNSK